MIVIEGSDRTGKTGLAHALIERLRADHEIELPYEHMGRPPEGGWQPKDYLPSACVQDRFHLGEIVYGRMLQLSDYGHMTNLRSTASMLRTRGVVVVVLYHSHEELLRRLYDESEGKQAYKKKQVVRANWCYQFLGDQWWNFCEDVSGQIPAENFALQDRIISEWRSTWTG